MISRPKTIKSGAKKFNKIAKTVSLFAVKFFDKNVLIALISIMTIITTPLCLLCVTLCQYETVLFSNKQNLFKRKKQFLFENVF